MKKMLTILGFAAALASVSAPSFASEEGIAAPAAGDESLMTRADDDFDSRHGTPNDIRDRRDWRRNGQRGVMCTARNIRGQTFHSTGRGRVPLYILQRQALQNCRRGSFLIFGRTCRLVGCRVVWGR